MIKNLDKMDTLNNHRGLQTKRRGKDLVLSEPYEHEKFSVRETQSEGSRTNNIYILLHR